MAPDVKSLSWQRSDNVRNTSLNGSTRRRLSDMFEKEKTKSGAVAKTKTSPLKEMKSNFSLNKLRMPRASPTRRAFRSGADKIAKTFQQLKLSVDTFSQRLKGPTRRRCRLENVDTPISTPQTRSRRILGRTPTRLYSPFGIDTPDPDNPLRSLAYESPKKRRSLRNKKQHVELENENKLNGRCIIQTRAMICQPSPTCSSLLDN